MSTMNTARYEQFLRRLFRLVEGGVLPRMQNDVSPVINIEDPGDDALLFWKGHRLAAGSVAGTADALEFGTASLFNPLGSGILVWVRQINLGMVTGNWRLNFTQDRTGTVQTTLGFSDSRASLVAVPKVELGFDSLVAPIASRWRQRATTGDAGQFIPARYVLAPGVGLQVGLDTAAAAMVVSFEWIERSAEDSELKTL